MYHPQRLKTSHFVWSTGLPDGCVFLNAKEKNEQPKSGWIKHGWKTIRSEEERQEIFDVLISNGFKWSSEWSTVILFEHQRWVRLSVGVFIHSCHTLPTIRSLKNRLNLNAPKKESFSSSNFPWFSGICLLPVRDSGYFGGCNRHRSSMCWGRPPTQYIFYPKNIPQRRSFFPFKSVSEKMSFQ